MNSYLVFPFKTRNKCYFYDTNRNSILNIDEGLYNILVNKDFENENLTEFKNKGFLNKNTVKTIKHPATDFMKDMVKNKLQTITLQVTQQCNLRCGYCVYSGSYITRKHTDKVMSKDVAKKSIDFLMDNSKNSDILNIGFYGGEPLLEFPLIKKCIRYAKKVSKGKEISFNITTNATILNEEIIRFFSDNNVSLMISLDGPKEIHDENRKFASSGKGTFDIIEKKINLIKENFPDYYKNIMFNTVVDPRQDFTCINEFFSNSELLKDSLISTNFISTDNMDREVAKEKGLLFIKYIEKYNFELFKMYLSKLGKYNRNDISKVAESSFDSMVTVMNRIRQITGLLPEESHPSGVCIPGIRKLFVNIYGDLYPCEKCSETSKDMMIGTIEDGFYIDKLVKILNIGNLNEEECKNCWCFRLCELCAVSVDDGKEFSISKRRDNCKRTKSNITEMLKEYCSLRELGCSFENEM